MDVVCYEQKKVKLSCYNVKSLSEVPHFHLELEMIVCFSGKVNCFLSGHNFDFGAGDIVLVFPNQAHNYKMLEDGEFLVITFYPELIPNMISYFKSCLPEQLKVNFNESDELKDILFGIKERYKETVDNSESLLIGYLNMAMFYMKPLLGAKPIANISSGNFEKICNYCIHNYRNKITLEILSKELHLSTQRISHIFNQNMRITIPQYVNYLRISEACRLLTETDDPVLKIYPNVGFDSFQTFNRAFYGLMKMTPKQFRKKTEKDTKEHNGIFL